jgi:hypothetical protein
MDEESVLKTPAGETVKSISFRDAMRTILLASAFGNVAELVLASG